VIYNLKKNTFRYLVKKFIKRFFSQRKVESLLYNGKFKKLSLLLMKPTAYNVGFAIKSKVNECTVKKTLIIDLNKRQQQKCCLLFFMEKRIEIGDKLPNLGILSLISMPISRSA
jgi:hypothetical protein